MAATSDNIFTISIEGFSAGYSPLAFDNSLTSFGGGGHASVMTNVDVLGENLTQGPGLVTLTNGTENGVVDEQIQFIMDRATAADETYAIGDTKLFKLSSTTVVSGGTPSFPQAVTNCTEGSSLLLLKGNLYGFYNKATGGDIFKMPLGTEIIDSDWGSTIPATGAASIEKTAHPSDKKEDIMVFGNGRYVGVYLEESDALNVQKLDFGEDATVSDVLYNSGYWYLAVNSGVITGDNRNEGQIYLYDGAALLGTLDDETGVGMQKIGFLYRINGVVYVAYQDLSSEGFIIGYINGRSLTPLTRFTGSLPNFQQKTLYRNTILFLSSGLAYSAGAMIGELPYQLSQIADGGHVTVGAIAAPFGTPMISSTDGSTAFKIAKFSGYDTSCAWKSIIFPVSKGKFKVMIDEIVVLTNVLGENARCDLKIEANQGTVIQTTAKQITTAGKTRHFFTNFGMPANLEDLRIALDWSNGSATNNVEIRSITINGHFVMST